MKISTIKQVTQRYGQRLKELGELASKEVSNHFMHITGTPGALVISNADLINMGLCDWKELRGEYNKGRRLLRDYLRLMDKFPDFKTAELNTHDGYFPDIRDEGGGGAENYITESKKRLIK